MYFVINGSLFYRGDDGTYLISKGEKVGETGNFQKISFCTFLKFLETLEDVMTEARRIGTLQTQSEEVQLASIHKESYQEIIYNQNKLGSGLSDIISKSALLSRWPMHLLPGKTQLLWMIPYFQIILQNG